MLRRVIALTMTVPFAAAILFSVRPGAAMAQTISITGNETPAGGFGKPNAATFGQTFKAPTGFTSLQSFSFWLQNDVTAGALNASSLQFRAYIMPWDNVNGKAAGPAQYTSATRTGPTALSQRYDFTVPGLALTANTSYVALLSASGLFGSIANSQSLAVMETTFNSSYANGQFVFTDNGDDLGKLISTQWQFTGFPDYQTHFAATFTPAVVTVPEPSSLALLVTGFLALMVVAVRRKGV